MPNHQRDRSVPQIRLEQPLPPLPLLPPSGSPVTARIRIQIPDQLQYEPYHDEESDGEEHSASEEVERSQNKRRVKKPYSDNHLSPISPSLAPLSPTRESYRDHLSPISPTRISISISHPQSPSSQISPRSTSPAPEDQSNPPEYAPMYDYLRSLPRPIHAFTSPNSNTFLSPTSLPQSPTDFMPYRDSIEHPFIITLSPLSPRQPNNGEGEEGPPSYEELYLQHPCPHRQGELQELVRQMDAEGHWAEEICKFVIGMVMLSLCVVGVGLAFNWGKGWGPPGQRYCNGQRCY